MGKFLKIMKNIIVIINLLFGFFYCSSQSFVVADEVTRDGIPFVTLSQNDKGLYSDNNGKVSCKDFDTSKIIYISHLNYKNITILCNSISDTIFLTANPIELNEVLVSTIKSKLVTVNPSSKSNNFGSWVLKPKTELLSLVIPATKKKVLLKEIVLPFVRSNERLRGNDTINVALVRINLYNVKEDKAAEQIFSSGPVKINSLEEERLYINLSGENIMVSSVGFYIGIEMLGYSNQQNKIVEKGSYVRPALSNKSRLVLKTYVRNIFSYPASLINVSKILRESSQMNIGERYLSVGITYQ